MIEVDCNKLPEEIKAKAKEYCDVELTHSYADTRQELEEDVIAAWLKGFAFCLQGKVQAHRKNFEKKCETYSIAWKIVLRMNLL